MSRVVRAETRVFFFLGPVLISIVLCTVKNINLMEVVHASKFVVTVS